jgi:Na+/H+ antiporter NhaD/arsenite permease-like protein
MTLCLIIFAITYALIVTEKVDRTAAAILGASAVIFLKLIPQEEALELVNLDVIFLLVGMMTVVGILAETGLFEWVAVFIAQRARGNGLVILFGLLIATAVLSAFLDNVTTVVLIVPITILITQILEIPTVPFLIFEALFSNIGGTATLVGDPPNILIGSEANLTFNEFLIHLTPAVLLVMVAILVLVWFVFRGSLNVTPAARSRIMKAVPALTITDPFRLKRGLIVFFLILFGFVFSRMIGVDPGTVALCGAFAMIVFTRSNVRQAMEKVEWETIFFLIGLFMLVGSLEHNGLFKLLGEAMFNLTQGNLLMTALATLWVSAVLSAVFGNIPVVIALIPLVHSLIPAFGTEMGLIDSEQLLILRVAQPLWWSLALGSCLGGNGTLYGAAANIVVAQIARKNNYPITFLQFTRYSFVTTIISLVVCSLYVYVRYFLLASSPL